MNGDSEQERAEQRARFGRRLIGGEGSIRMRPTVERSDSELPPEFAAAADAGDAFLLGRNPETTTRVARQPWRMSYDDRVILLERDRVHVDDSVLVYDRATGEVRFKTCPPWEPFPFPDVVPLFDLSTVEVDPSVPLILPSVNPLTGK